jgi:hypothetical protein
MFTPARLLDIALSAQAEMDASPREFRWDAMRARDEALNVAAWMEQHGITEAKSIGPFGSSALKQGDKVRVRKGAKIRGTGNNVPDRAGATHTVTVVSVDRGSVFEERPGQIRVVNEMVHWAGRGGYWRWTDASNVEPLIGE